MADIISGQLDFTFITQFAVLPFVNNPNVQILGIVDDHPSAALPGVPTFKSQGYPQLTHIYEIHAIWAPADTPDSVVKKLRQEIQNLNQGAVRKELIDMQLLNPNIVFSSDPQTEINNLLKRYTYLKANAKK
jgi:tripartite-type tricarboxylate transporter receptor subunit TctC